MAPGEGRSREIGVLGADDTENRLRETGDDGDDTENIDDDRVVLVDGVAERRKISGKNLNSLSLVDIPLVREVGLESLVIITRVPVPVD